MPLARVFAQDLTVGQELPTLLGNEILIVTITTIDPHDVNDYEGFDVTYEGTDNTNSLVINTLNFRNNQPIDALIP